MKPSGFVIFIPFRLLLTKSPTLIKRHHQAICVWSAACSPGQEPYSISMVIEEHREMYQQAHLQNPSINIVGTDLSSQILQIARAG